MYYNSWCEIDVKAFRDNLSYLKKLAVKRKLIPILKADAYGHGLEILSEICVNLGITHIGVVDFHEGLKLLHLLPKIKILLLVGLRKEEIEEGIRKGFLPIVYNMEDLQLIDFYAKRLKKRAHIYLKFDTGMGRLGFTMESISKVIDFLISSQDIAVDGLLSHLSTADMEDTEFVELQIDRFKSIIREFYKKGLKPVENSIANSACLFRGLDRSLSSDFNVNLVRVGIALYGINPSPQVFKKVSLAPVMSLKTKIIQLKEIPANYSVSYGRTYITSSPQKIAVLPIGYSNGLNRRLSNKGEVIVRGMRAQIVGRICMNLTVINVTHIPGISVGDEVVILGKQAEDMIRAEEIAKALDTIPYEILCQFGNNNPKIYTNCDNF